jgi:hypothetical protein
MKLCIMNDGEIDLNALFLLGASTKEGQGKIGFFGSGNKYAIATLLRLGVPFEIYSGKHRIAITTELVGFRGESFQQIVLDGKPTSFTTRMGPSWELWYAIREFYCNALDEGGESFTVVNTELPMDGKTTIYIEMTPEVEKVWNERQRYFLPKNFEPLYKATTEFGEAKVYGAEDGRCRIYRKGICVHQESMRAAFWYDFDELSINESRETQYSYEYLEDIAAAMMCAPTKELAIMCIDGAEDHDTLEGQVQFGYVNTTQFSDAWKEAIGSRTVIKHSWVPHLAREDVCAGVVLPDNCVDRLQAQFPDLNYRDKIVGDFEEAEPTPEQKKMLDKAIEEINDMGYGNSCGVLYGRFKSNTTMGAYNAIDHKIRISLDFFDKGYDELVATFLEEFLHAAGYNDGSREFEGYLMKELVHASRRNNER